MSRTRHDDGWFAQQLEDPEVRVAFDQERAGFEFIEQLERCMAQSDVSKAELARRLGRSRAFVTQALARGRNLTIKTMTELATACGYELHVMLRRRSDDTINPIFVDPMPDWQSIRRGYMTIEAPAVEAGSFEDSADKGEFPEEPVSTLWAPPSLLGSGSVSELVS